MAHYELGGIADMGHVNHAVVKTLGGLIAIVAGTIAAVDYLDERYCRPNDTDPSCTIEQPISEISIPIGAVVPFFATPSEIAGLSPNWMIADGSLVMSDVSPLRGRRLPDLRERFIMGAEGDADVMDNSTNTGGGHSATVSVLNIGPPRWTNINDNPTDQFRSSPQWDGYFVIDTNENENSYSSHSHDLSIELQHDQPTPFRRLIYMVRVL